MARTVDTVGRASTVPCPYELSVDIDVGSLVGHAVIECPPQEGADIVPVECHCKAACCRQRDTRHGAESTMYRICESCGELIRNPVRRLVIVAPARARISQQQVIAKHRRLSRGPVPDD